MSEDAGLNSLARFMSVESAVPTVDATPTTNDNEFLEGFQKAWKSLSDSTADLLKATGDGFKATGDGIAEGFQKTGDETGKLLKATGDSFKGMSDEMAKAMAGLQQEPAIKEAAEFGTAAPEVAEWRGLQVNLFVHRLSPPISFPLLPTPN